MKDRRTKLQKSFNMRMAKCGTMTQETQREHRSADYSRHKDKGPYEYGEALGISVEAALYLIYKHEDVLEGFEQ